MTRRVFYEQFWVKRSGGPYLPPEVLHKVREGEAVREDVCLREYGYGDGMMVSRFYWKGDSMSLAIPARAVEKKKFVVNFSFKAEFEARTDSEALELAAARLRLGFDRTRGLALAVIAAVPLTPPVPTEDVSGAKDVADQTSAPEAVRRRFCFGMGFEPKQLRSSGCGIVCRCVVVCNEVPNGGDGGGSASSPVQEFDHIEMCPLHQAAAAMWEHAAALIPHLMGTNFDADATTHIIALKKVIGEAAQ